MTTMTSNIDNKTYEPRPSAGWVWVGAFGLALLGLGLGVAIRWGLTGPFIVTTLLTVPIGIGFLVIAGGSQGRDAAAGAAHHARLSGLRREGQALHREELKEDKIKSSPARPGNPRCAPW